MAQNAAQKIASKTSGLSSRKTKIVGKTLAHVKEFPTAPELFTKSFYANVLQDDLNLFSATDRKRIAGSIWHLAQEREPGKLKLRLYNPSPAVDGWTVDHTVLDIINDDMPFLVDSVTGALQRCGLTLHTIIHPVLHVRRDAAGKLIDVVSNANVAGAHAESFIHVQFDHCLDQEFLHELLADIERVLADVRITIEDWPKMRQRMASAIEINHKRSKADDSDDAQAFMRWLDNNNFTYLGFRDIDLSYDKGRLSSIEIVPGSGLGVLRDPDLPMFGGLRDMKAHQRPALQTYAQNDQTIFVTKTNVISRVHRRVPMDAVFVRRFDDSGNVVGECLFVGLFTSKSYSQSPSEIPFLRRKIEHVIKRTNLRHESHDGKVLVHILNTYPHDELFQISEEELTANALRILQLQERPRLSLVTRIDPFSRFVTCLIFIPKEQYSSGLRQRFQKYLECAFNAQMQDWHIRVDDSMLARAFVRLNVTVDSTMPDIKKVESDLREICRNWPDRLRDRLVNKYGEATGLALLRRYGRAFPLSYREATEPDTALRDIHHLEHFKTLGEQAPVIVDLTQPEKGEHLRLKLFQGNHALGLSEILPLIESSGLKIEYMGGPYEVKPESKDHASVFIHEFVGHPAHPSIADFKHIKPAFEEAFKCIWRGEVESDAFNMLTLLAGLNAREITLLRAMARYLRQLRIPYGHGLMASTFINNPAVAQKLVALFIARHNPDLNGNRNQICKNIEGEITEALAKIDVLEEDRIIRRYLNLIQSSLRTNFFQKDADGARKSYISIKFDSRALDFMPLPKPLYEIFVYSTRTEAVHLRGGKVARGGIRWSDRREDFRNEILNLMKAQMVKNSVIVPVGSKGGFIVKHPPAEADKMQAEGIACYRIMMCGMLDITDNRVGNKIVPPARVVRHDGDDPYLVVAADKGTAKFSDIANGISQEYKFWLDDAFASGGSAGYDHKGMGITARGAWESVKRHFRELNKDIQTTDFTCIGVGDMSGDVFGNGMLLSRHTCLLGAFDHRHIFCDPHPDSEISFVERQRLFNLPRSSWADYDAKKISKGGGVFARSEKLIRISAEMKKAYSITADTLPPSELIQAMLKAEVELLYFGGIGTYVKASTETHEEVGDRATEAVRIDGDDLRAKVIGEGANLGMTQRGRIEYALRGGHLNTDAIDNSAGVDTSDHEVNIKILLRKCVDSGSMSLEARNKLLGSMTDELGKLVLRDNYLQTQALSVSEFRAASQLQSHMRTMHLLEKSGLLNRAVEFLPNSSEIAEYQRLGRGLTRPEIAVVMAYAKIWLYDQLLVSDLPDDPYMQADLNNYFPQALQKKFPQEIVKHQLAREIIATAVTNSVVNRAGTNFILAITDQTGKSAPVVTRAYVIVREAFGLRNFWREIEELDNRVAARTQASMNLIVREMLDQSVLWFLSQPETSKKLTPAIATYSQSVARLADWLKKQTQSPMMQNQKKFALSLIAEGVPEKLANNISLLPVLSSALDVMRLSVEFKVDIAAAAEIFFGIGQRLGLDWLIEQTRSIQAQTPWQREAAKNIAHDITQTQRRLTESIVKSASAKKPVSLAQRLADWCDRNSAKIERYDTQMNEWRSFGPVDIAILTLASRQLSEL